MTKPAAADQVSFSSPSPPFRFLSFFILVRDLEESSSAHWTSMTVVDLLHDAVTAEVVSIRARAEYDELFVLL